MGKLAAILIGSVALVATTTLAFAGPSSHVLHFKYNDVVPCSQVIVGTSGADTLDESASPCSVRFVGMQGADTMTGGSASNTYAYTRARDSRPLTPDMVTDFDTSKDVLDFSAACAYAGVACHFMGDAWLDGTPGAVAYSLSQAWRCNPDGTCGDFYFTEVWVDLDGDGQADMAVGLYGQLFPASSNFTF